VLEEIRAGWIAENGMVPAGNAQDQSAWEKPIDAKVLMNDTEKAALARADGLEAIKLMKQVARRVEATVLEKLQARGAQMEMRFNPKLKEEGLLDLK
jgi:uncharacterized protein (DUF4415 family)